MKILKPKMIPIHKLSISLTSLAAVILLHPLLIQAQSTSPNTASDAAEIDIIKENVKQRIRQTVTGDPFTTDSSLAFSGTLSSIANETLTIQTQTGIKLASTSAETQYVLETDDDEQTAQVEDLAIDTFIVAMGYINTSQVLDTKKIIIHSSTPTPPANQTGYGIVTSYDKQNDTVTINNPFSNVSVTGIISKNTDYFETNPDGNTSASDEDAIIVNQSLALIVYTPGDETSSNDIQSILLNNQKVTSPLTNSASQSADLNLPPELQ